MFLNRAPENLALPAAGRGGRHGKRRGRAAYGAPRWRPRRRRLARKRLPRRRCAPAPAHARQRETLRDAFFQPLNAPPAAAAARAHGPC